MALIIARMGEKVRQYAALLHLRFRAAHSRSPRRGRIQSQTEVFRNVIQVLNRATKKYPCIRLHSICLVQAKRKTFSKLSNSFSAGHLPSRSEVTGTWVLIGFWLHRDSHPDLNCAGIMRGQIFEWVMLAQGYSLRIDMAGTSQTSAFELGRGQDITVAMDLGGDNSPVLRCRLTNHDSLVCLGDTYYSGLEFRKTQVHCEPPNPNSNAIIEPMLCYPYKRESPLPQ